MAMANPLPVSPVDRPASEIDYKTLSAVAVAAIIYASLYVIIIAIVVLMPFRTKAPLSTFACRCCWCYRAGLGWVCRLPPGCTSVAPRALEPD